MSTNSKRLLAAALALSMFSPLPSFAEEKIVPPSAVKTTKATKPTETARTKFFVQVEFLSGTDEDGACVDSIVFEGHPGAVGVAQTTEAERAAGKKVDGTVVEFTPETLPDGKIKVKVKASKAGKALLEACTVGESGHRIVLHGEKITVAITPYEIAPCLKCEAKACHEPHA